MSKYGFLMVLKFAQLLLWLNLNIALCNRNDRDSKYRIPRLELVSNPLDVEYEDTDQIQTVTQRNHHVAADDPRKMMLSIKKGSTKRRKNIRGNIENRDIKISETTSSEAYEKRKHKIKNSGFIKKSKRNYKKQSQVQINAEKLENEENSSSDESIQLWTTKSSVQKLRKTKNIYTITAPDNIAIIPIYEEHKKTTLTDFVRLRNETKQTTITQARLNHDDFVKIREILNRFESQIVEADKVKTNSSSESNMKILLDTSSSDKPAHRPEVGQKSNIKNEMNSLEDKSKEKPDDRLKIIETHGLEKKKMRPKTKVSRLKSKIKKKYIIQPTPKRQKSRTRFIDTRESLDRFESKTVKSNTKIKNVTKRLHDSSKNDNSEDMLDIRKKITKQTDSWKKKKRKAKTKVTSTNRLTSKAKEIKFSKPTSIRPKSRTRFIDTRETLDRFKLNTVKSSSNIKSEINMLEDHSRNDNFDDRPDVRQKITHLDSVEKKKRRPKTKLNKLNNILRLKSKNKEIKSYPTSNRSKNHFRVIDTRETLRNRFDSETVKIRSNTENMNNSLEGNEESEHEPNSNNEESEHEPDDYEKLKTKDEKSKTKTTTVKNYLSTDNMNTNFEDSSNNEESEHKPNDYQKLTTKDKKSKSTTVKTYLSIENMNISLEDNSSNEESEYKPNVYQKLSTNHDNWEESATKSTTVKTNLSTENINNSLDYNSIKENSEPKPDFTQKLTTKIDSWLQNTTKSITEKLHEDEVTGVTQKGRVKDHQKIENVEDLKYLHPHSIAKQLRYLAKLLENNYSITQETIGRTAEYNDIVLWKIRQHVRFSFRASTDEKKNVFINPQTEKKIIFIVHGLTVMGWHKVPCFNTITEFLKLFTYYGDNLDAFDIFLIPMANPDGVTMALHKIWNKNMSPQDICPGVNVDRNFDVAWKDSLQAPSCNQLYPGPYPFSEQESIAVQRVFNNYGQKIAAYFHVHVGVFDHQSLKGDAILYPIGYMDMPYDETRYVDLRGDIDDAMANKSFKVLSVTVDTLYNWYGKVTGSSVDYASQVLGIPYALELVMQIYESATKIVEDAALTELWQSLIDVIFDHIARAQSKIDAGENSN